MSYMDSCDRINEITSDKEQGRAKPRFDPALLTCDRGKLIDISASGLCVRSKFKWGSRGKRRTVHLASPSGSLNVEVTIARVTRCGPFSVETGCRFVDTDKVADDGLFALFHEKIASERSEFSVRAI